MVVSFCTAQSPIAHSTFALPICSVPVMGAQGYIHQLIVSTTRMTLPFSYVVTGYW